MRSFLVVLVSVFLVSTANAVLACSLPHDWSYQKEFDESNEVFRAFVTRVEVSDYEFDDKKADGFFIIEVYYELKEVLKGTPRKEGPILTHTAIGGGCGVPVLAGFDYVFFTYPANRNDDPAFAELANGIISLSGTSSLHTNEKFAEQKMAYFRSLAKK